MTDRTTRLAPSPTGALHLGNARTFLINYLLAKRHGDTRLSHYRQLGVTSQRIVGLLVL